MKIIPAVQKMLEDIANGDITSAIRKIKFKAFFKYRKSGLSKKWQQTQENKGDYENQYAFFQELNEFAFHNIKEKDKWYWIKRALLGLLTIVIGAIITINIETWYDKIINLGNNKIDECTVVVSNIGSPEHKNLTKVISSAIMKLEPNHKTKFIVTEKEEILDKSIIDEVLLKHIKGTPQLVISGWYSNKDTLRLELFTPPENITDSLSIPKNHKFNFTEIDPTKLGIIFQKSGFDLVIMYSLNNPSACPGSIQYINDKTNTNLAKVKTAENRALVSNYNAEFNYAQSNHSQAENAMNISIENAPDDINSYAMRGLIRDELDKVPTAFQDYTHYVENFERTGNPPVSSYKVRDYRRKMVSEAYAVKGDAIFTNSFTKEKLLKSLKNDVRFFESNSIDGMDNIRLLALTKNFIAKIENINHQINGKVVDHDNVGIQNVTIQIMTQTGVDYIDTEENGDYKAEGILPNSTIEFSKAGYESKTEIVNNRSTINVQLTKTIDPETPVPPIKITGTIREENGSPVMGATVMIEGRALSTTSKFGGEFELSTTGGPGKVVISFVGYESQSKSFNRSTTLDFIIPGQNPTEYVVKGIVKKINGTPLSQAIIQVVNTSLSTRTNQYGAFSLRSNAPINQLKVNREGYYEKIVAVGNVERVQIILTDAPTVHVLKGKIIDQNSRGIQNANISIIGTNRSIQSRSNGVFELSSTTYPEELIVKKEGYETEEILLNDLNPITITLKKTRTTRTVTGRVVDVNNVGIDQVSISEPGTRNGTATRSNGAFSLNNIKPSSNFLKINHHDYPDQEDVNITDQDEITIVLGDNNLKPIILTFQGFDFIESSNLEAKMYRFKNILDYRKFKEMVGVNASDSNARTNPQTILLMAINQEVVTPDKIYEFSRKRNILTSSEKFNFKDLVEDEYHYLVIYTVNNKSNSIDGKELIKRSEFSGEYTFR